MQDYAEKFLSYNYIVYNTDLPTRSYNYIVYIIQIYRQENVLLYRILCRLTDKKFLSYNYIVNNGDLPTRDV